MLQFMVFDNIIMDGLSDMIIVNIVRRPAAGGFRDSISQHYVGGGHQLRNPDLVGSAADRHRLTTVSMGKVHLQVGVIVRNFDKFGVEC